MKLFKNLFRKRNSKRLNKTAYSGGDGSSEENAVIINCDNSLFGISYEYSYIEDLYGKPNEDWTVKLQSLIHKNEKSYDKIEIELKNGYKNIIYFDITRFFGKF